MDKGPAFLSRLSGNRDMSKTSAMDSDPTKEVVDGMEENDRKDENKALEDSIDKTLPTTSPYDAGKADSGILGRYNGVPMKTIALSPPSIVDNPDATPEEGADAAPGNADTVVSGR